MELLQRFQQDLPGKAGQLYLEQRGIPLEIAVRYGAGYAWPGTWPHKARDWKHGRAVFPHTNPQGEIVNLYGRAVGSSVPAGLRHDHLPGPRGVFNATALQRETVFVCEGVFDALSLIAAGYSNAIAIFGIEGLRWPWFRHVRRIIFALDADARGQEAWRQLAREAVLRGKEVFYIPEEVYQGCKDLNEYWAKFGRLDLGDFDPHNTPCSSNPPGLQPLESDSRPRAPATTPPQPTPAATRGVACSPLEVHWSSERGWLLLKGPHTGE